MPTSVEMSPFKVIEGAYKEAELDSAFASIDTDLSNVLDATSKDGFLKAEMSLSLLKDTEVLGDSFLGLGDNLKKIDEATQAFADLFIKLQAPPTTTTTSDAVVTGGGGVQADFATLESSLASSSKDLTVVGKDFSQLTSADSLADFESKLTTISDDFMNLSQDFGSGGNGDSGKVDLSDAFDMLGKDFTQLGEQGSTKVDMAYQALGKDLTGLGATFDQLSMDSMNLGDDFLSLGGASTPVAADLLSKDTGATESLGPIGNDLNTLYTDFLTLNSEFVTAGSDAAMVLGDLFSKDFTNGSSPSSEGTFGHIFGVTGGKT